MLNKGSGLKGLLNPSWLGLFRGFFLLNMSMEEDGEQERDGSDILSLNLDLIFFSKSWGWSFSSSLLRNRDPDGPGIQSGNFSLKFRNDFSIFP